MAGERSRYKIEQPGLREQVIGLLAAGRLPRDIVPVLAGSGVTVTRKAIQAFRTRHTAEIAAIVERTREVVDGIALREKSARVRELARMFDELRTLANDRGYVVRSERHDGEQVHVRERFDPSLSKEMRACLRDIAEELGEIPRAIIPPDGAAVRGSPVILNVNVIRMPDGTTRILESEPFDVEYSAAG